MKTSLLVLLGLGLMAGPAMAGKTKPRKVMVFITEKDAPREIVTAAETFCVKAEAFYSVGVWQKKKLKNKVAKCGDAACLAKLARKKKLTHLTVGRAHPSAKGVRLAFRTVDVETNAVIRESELVIASTAEAQSTMARAYFGIAGITTPGYVAIANAPASIRVDGRDVAVNDGKLELLPGPHKLRVNDEEQEVMILPRETREVEFASLTPPPATSEPAASPETIEAVAMTEAVEEDLVAPLEAEPAVEETVTAGDGGGMGLWTWVGIGAVGTGAVLLGVSAVFGAKTAVEVDGNTTQLEARRRNEDARSNATTANALLISGGVLALAGATLVAVDMLSGPGVSVTAAPVGDGAAVVVGGRW